MRRAAACTLAAGVICGAIVAVGHHSRTSSVPVPGHVRPIAAITPGAADARVTQANIASTICVPGYTATVRPPASFTSALKRHQIVQYGYADTAPAHFEEDHEIPLEIGGAPADARNLWPQPLAQARVKDHEENQLHQAVCSGQLTLGQAQAKILRDWGP